MLRIIERIGIPFSHPSATTYRTLLRAKQGRPAKDSQQFRECGFLLAQLGKLGELIDEKGVREWFAFILAATMPGNLSDEEISHRWEMVVFAFDGKPKFLFDRASLKAAVLKFPWLPTAAELWELIASEFYEFQSLVRELNFFLGRSLDAPFPTADEIKHNGWDDITPRLATIEKYITREEFQSLRLRYANQA